MYLSTALHVKDDCSFSESICRKTVQIQITEGANFVNTACRGFFICLGEDGHMYDDNKYTWLESRQVRGKERETGGEREREREREFSLPFKCTCA